MIDLVCRQIMQVTVVALLAAAAMHWMCRRRPHLAYMLGLIVLAKCWTPPIWSCQGGVFCWPPMNHGAAHQGEAPRGEVRQASPATGIAGAAELQQRARPAPAEYHSPVLLAMPKADANRRQSFAGWLLAAWLAGAVACVLAMCIRWRRWYRGIAAVTAPRGNRVLVLATDTAMRLGLRRVPRLLVSRSGSGPAVYGFLRPTIIIPHRLLAAGNAENLRMVLTHEMLHIRRGDLYVSLLQFATSAAWWFHPAIWWISRRLTRERERSCDEELLAGLRCSPSEYAQCLLDMLRQQRHEMVPALPGMRAVDITQQRFEHIMYSHGAAHRRTPLRYWLLAGMTLLIVLPGQRLDLAISEELGPSARDTVREARPATKSVSKPAAPATEQAQKAPPERRADQSRPRPAKLEQAIDRGVSYLKIEQQADGHWLDPVGYPGGITSLCTLSLLKWGMKPDERTAQSALKHLRAIKPSMTYSTSLQTLVFCAADAKADQKLIERNVQWLVKTQKTAGQYAGAWGYPQAEGDNSNTAFAIWALYEADQAGVKAGNAAWRHTLDYWLKHQNADGSWGYKPQLGGTGSMTSQGLFCVAAAAKVLAEDKPEQPPEQAIKKAAGWLGNRFSVQQNPGSHGQQGWQFYYLLALGKAGHISGRDQFGNHRWSAEGAEALLDKQQSDGSWKGTGHAEDDPMLATAMALLFLMQDAK